MNKKKCLAAATIILFAGLITAAPLSWYLRPEEERNQNSENRTLAAFPKVETLSDLGSAPAQFESWYSDHLPYKEQMVTLKSDGEIKLFGQLDSDRVILGKKHPWLFYKAPDGQAIETYKHINPFTEESMENIVSVLYSLQTRLYEAGIDFVFMIVPDKETIYGPDYMPDDIKVEEDQVQRTDQLLSYMAEHAPDIKVLYPKETMLREKEGLYAAAREKSEETGETWEAWPLYYETDTHWNRIGAKVGADALFDLLSETDRNYLTEYIDVQFTDLADGTLPAFPAAGEKMYITGDMQNLCKLPKSFDSQEFMPDFVLPADVTYQVDSPYGEVVYQRFHATDTRTAKRDLYIAGDSFRGLLTDFVKGRAENCTLVSRYYLDVEDVLAQHPDTFVYMIAERYLHETEVLPGVASPSLEYTEGFKKSDIY